jgi:MSHA biogenesis protein MshK
VVRRHLTDLVLLLLGAGAFNAWALQDPTRPTDPAAYFGQGQKVVATTWALQSILSSADRRVAIINGTRVQEGDRIGTARVVRIQPSRVVLNTAGRTLTLQLWPESTRKVKP